MAAPTCRWKPCAGSCGWSRTATLRARSLLFSASQATRSHYQWTDGAPEFGDLFSAGLEELLGPRRQPDDPLEDRHRDIARSVQAMYEEAFFHLIGKLQNGSRSDRSRARRRLRDEFGRQRQSAAHDALPARLCAGGRRRRGRRDRRGLCRLAQARRQPILRDGSRLLGTAFQPQVISRSLSRAQGEIEAGRLRDRRDRRRGEALPAHGVSYRRRQSRRLVSGADGVGPRALGNRSIVCDPRRADMKAILNAKIKRRSLSGPLRRRFSKRLWRIGSKRTTPFPS